MTRLDDRLHQLVKERAARERRSVNRWVVDALERALAEQPTPAEAFDQQLRQRGLWWEPDEEALPPYDRAEDEVARRRAAELGLRVSDLVDALRDER